MVRLNPRLYASSPSNKLTVLEASIEDGPFHASTWEAKASRALGLAWSTYDILSQSGLHSQNSVTNSVSKKKEGATCYSQAQDVDLW